MGTKLKVALYVLIAGAILIVVALTLNNAVDTCISQEQGAYCLTLNRIAFFTFNGVLAIIGGVGVAVLPDKRKPKY